MFFLIPVDITPLLHIVVTERERCFLTAQTHKLTLLLSAITVCVQKVCAPKTKAYYKGEKLVALRRCQRQ